MYRHAYAHFDDTGKWFTAGGEHFSYREGLGAYEYLMGALAGCFTSTFLDELAQCGMTVGPIDVHCCGRKREEVPTTLEQTRIELRVHALRKEDESTIMDCIEKTKEHCSMYQTIKCVSTMIVECEVLS